MQMKKRNKKKYNANQAHLHSVLVSITCEMLLIQVFLPLKSQCTCIRNGFKHRYIAYKTQDFPFCQNTTCGGAISSKKVVTSLIMTIW